jgi:hypothetical protein
VFILRRSAGFAYSIVSLLRAEPANVKATLLPVAATALLGHVESGLVEEKKDKDNLALTASDGSDSGNEKWRSCVHALVCSLFYHLYICTVGCSEIHVF